MYCNQCGHHNPDGSGFCGGCGMRLATATAASPASTTPEASGFDGEAWRALIGAKGADYYLPRMQAIAAGGSARWHWPALFVTWYWLLYRKQWGLSFLYLLSPYLLIALVAMAGAMLGDSGEVVAAVLAIVAVAAYIFVPPLFANHWYYRKGTKVMAAMRTSTPSREAYLGALAARGGTSSSIPIVVVVFVFIAVIGILAAVAIPAYQDYTKRAKVMEGVMHGRATATAVLEHWRATKGIPPSADGLPGAPGLPATVGKVEIDGTNGAVRVEVKGIGTVRLVPNTDGSIDCSSDDIKPNLLPSACRK
jgi:hypothetical protein